MIENKGNEMDKWRWKKVMKNVKYNVHKLQGKSKMLVKKNKNIRNKMLKEWKKMKEKQMYLWLQNWKKWLLNKWNIKWNKKIIKRLRFVNNAYMIFFNVLPSKIWSYKMIMKCINVFNQKHFWS